MHRFERRHEALAPSGVFARRVFRSFALGMTLVLVSLLAGTLGYHFTAGLGWLDAELNAAMILTGMGPVNPITNVAGKVFASIYALFSGVAFLASVGVIFAPILHRLLHSFHLEGAEKGRADRRASSKGSA
jgi:hypothetical protein